VASGPAALLIAFTLALPAVAAEGPALTLHANAADGTDVPLTIELFRWSTDAERAPLLAALAPAPPQTAASVSAGPAGAAGRAGRAGRGGRGSATPPPTPVARLTTAVKAAPTIGFIWGAGVTGYSIKYAWRTTDRVAGERIVLVTDRRLGAHVPHWAAAAGGATDAEFTLIEMRVDAKGDGEGKASLATNVVVDAAAQTLALDGYATAPTLLRVSR
jgi:hypothetical protein